MRGKYSFFCYLRKVVGISRRRPSSSRQHEYAVDWDGRLGVVHGACAAAISILSAPASTRERRFGAFSSVGLMGADANLSLEFTVQRLDQACRIDHPAPTVERAVGDSKSPAARASSDTFFDFGRRL